jgi:hypothetical protein
MSELSDDKFGDVMDCITECENYNYMTRDSALQREACEKLVDVLRRLAEMKKDAIKQKDEDRANRILGFQCATQFLRSEIAMLLLLKADKPDEAWRELINAQRAIADAVRAHNAFNHLEPTAQRLSIMEKVLFPPQVFTSLGVVVKSRRCSICGEEYGEECCDHLIGKPYMGEICHTITEPESWNHLAMVKNPSDKLSRVMTFDVPDGKRNRMTWKIESSSVADGAPSDPNAAARRPAN